MVLSSKFSIRKAVNVLFTGDDPRELLWHLSRSLAWAFLDQKLGQQPRRARNAKHIGHIILSRWIHRRWSEMEKGQIDDDLRRLLEVYRRFGGLNRGVKTPTPRTLLTRFKKVESKTRFVSEIVNYLCRVDADGSVRKGTFTVDFAKLYVEKTQKKFVSNIVYGNSQISKIWEKYAPSAPLIYAVYQITPNLAGMERVEQISACLSNISMNPTQIRRLIGYASFAADVLAKTSVRKVFVKSFKEAGSVCPDLPPFSEAEKETISRIDKDAPIK